MKKSPGLPKRIRYIDLEVRSIHIPPGSILSAQLNSTVFAQPVGVYGTAKYGQATYGVQVGIYGTSKYTEQVYS